MVMRFWTRTCAHMHPTSFLVVGYGITMNKRANDGPGKATHTLSPNALEAEVCRSLWVQGQFGLHSKFRPVRATQGDQPSKQAVFGPQDDTAMHACLSSSIVPDPDNRLFLWLLAISCPWAWPSLYDAHLPSQCIAETEPGLDENRLLVKLQLWGSLKNAYLSVWSLAHRCCV